MRRLGATVVVVLAIGCQPPEPELPPIVWEGEHLRYRSDESVDSICGGTFQHLDERVAHIADIFDVPPEVMVDYSWTPGDALGEYCKPSLLGCAFGMSAFSKMASDEHELFHATRGASAYPGLEEGLAVMYGDDRRLPGEVNGNIEEILRNSREFGEVDALDYPRLGHFVSYLRAEFGQDGVAALDQRSASSHDYAQLSASIEEEFGIPMEDVLADYAARYPICQSTQYRYDGFECSGEGLVLPPGEDGKIVTTIPVGCDDPDTLGPRGGKIWKTVSLHIPEEGQHDITIFGGGSLPARVTIDECDVSCFDVETAYHREFGGLLNDFACFKEGTYRIRIEIDADARGDFDVEISQRFPAICD